MSDTVLVGLIAGGFSVVCEVIIAVVTNRATMKELEKQSELADARLEKSQAITDTKLDELTREVREHNNFARRVPVMEEQIKVANNRIADLERLTAR